MDSKEEDNRHVEAFIALCQTRLCHHRHQNDPYRHHHQSDTTKEALLEKVKGMVSQFPELTNAQNDDGSTGLMFAADNGDEEIVKYLISRGSDIDLENNVS